MRLGYRLLGFALVAGAAVWFAAVNGGQRVRIHLGIFTLRSVSLPVVVFASIILGMSVVFLAGLRADLRTRRTLRRYRETLEGRSDPTGAAGLGGGDSGAAGSGVRRTTPGA
ncbi:MAG: hypothetical protein ACE5JR_00345 [Gemmatimonadota bacterium]